MPWKCPACQTQIRLDGDAPQPGQIYRCHVCRVELVLNEALQQLTVAPLPGESTNAASSRRDRR
jgi:hypothetical protein